ncbi:hypothetical protein M231_08110 [Tremella mesenterica]|uniref:Uncharacterized protein n=1 Tax=Tremella mesenterica TaxID=5217 RepID=A0A4Q1BAF5_TREME|nr:hypothetical protein M231_08110 [Tremella mesenterica]
MSNSQKVDLHVGLPADQYLMQSITQIPQERNLDLGAGTNEHIRLLEAALDLSECVDVDQATDVIRRFGRSPMAPRGKRLQDGQTTAEEEGCYTLSTSQFPYLVKLTDCGLDVLRWAEAVSKKGITREIEANWTTQDDVKASVKWTIKWDEGNNITDREQSFILGPHSLSLVTNSTEWEPQILCEVKEDGAPIFRSSETNWTSQQVQDILRRWESEGIS